MSTTRAFVILLLCAGPLLAQTWEPRTDMPTPRWDAGCAVVDGKAYVIGGRDEFGVPALTVVEAYDVATNAWSRRADMPTPRGRVAVAAFDGKIYVFGGTPGGETASPALNVVEVYDPVSDGWNSAAAMPYDAQGSTAVVVEDRIYLIGGISWPDLLSAWEYDPAADAWAQRADMPTPRGLHGSGLLSDTIFAVGGIIQGVWGARSLYAYDLAADAWTRGPNMPTARVALLGAVAEDQLYTIGGESGVPGGLSVVETYDADADAWAPGPSLTTGRSRHTGGVVDGTILAIGGQDAAGSVTGSVEALVLRPPSTAVRGATWGRVKAGRTAVAFGEDAP